MLTKLLSKIRNYGAIYLDENGNQSYDGVGNLLKIGDVLRKFKITGYSCKLHRIVGISKKIYPSESEVIGNIKDKTFHRYKKHELKLDSTYQRD